MKWIIHSLLIAVLAAPCLAAAPEETDPYAARMRELDLKAKEAEVEFQRQMHQLDLEARRAEIARLRRPVYGVGRQCGGGVAVFLLGMIAIRAMATVWVYRDLQQNRTASGLWIPLVLVGGLPALIAYLLARLATPQPPRTAPA